MSDLQQSILALSPQARLELASFILKSLSGEQFQDGESIPEAWLEEARNEIEKMKTGEAPTFSWEEIKAFTRAR